MKNDHQLAGDFMTSRKGMAVVSEVVLESPSITKFSMSSQKADGVGVHSISDSYMYQKNIWAMYKHCIQAVQKRFRRTGALYMGSLLKTEKDCAKKLIVKDEYAKKLVMKDDCTKKLIMKDDCAQKLTGFAVNKDGDAEPHLDAKTQVSGLTISMQENLNTTTTRMTEYQKMLPVSQKREKGMRALIHKYVPEKRGNCTTRVWCTDVPMKNDHQLAGDFMTSRKGMAVVSEVVLESPSITKFSMSSEKPDGVGVHSISDSYMYQKNIWVLYKQCIQAFQKRRTGALYMGSLLTTEEDCAKRLIVKDECTKKLIMKDDCPKKLTGFAVNKDGDTEPHLDAKTQFFVMVSGLTISMQENLNTTTTRMMIERACERRGIRDHNCYAVYHGHKLEDTKLLIDCAIERDCIVDVRTRMRGGQDKTIKCTLKSLNDMLLRRQRFHVVRFPHKLRNYKRGIRHATFLSDYIKWLARQVLIAMCRMHYRGKSFDGAFEAKHIFFSNGRVIFDETLVEITFTGSTCKKDFAVIENIFRTIFMLQGGGFPLFVAHLLKYLRDCPAGGDSNSEACIAYLIGHPALSAYTERISQYSLLDSMLSRLNKNEFAAFVAAVGPLHNWENNLLDVIEMDITYWFDAKYDASGTTWSIYGDNPVGCLRYSRNHLKHADFQLLLEKIEAAFCANVLDFLADLLQNIAINFKGPSTFDFVKLLGDYVADLKQ
ncbi:unnamed protein product [Urochloa humidicola]